MPRASSRKPPTSGPPPLAVTNPSAGIARLRNRLGELVALDPAAPKDPRFEALEDAIHSNVREIFGENSHEDDAHWSLKIEHSDEPFYLSNGYDDPDDEYPGSYGHDRANARRVKTRTDGIARTKLTLESLIKRLEERAADRAQTQNEGVGDMGSPLDHLAEDRITLIKANGKATMVGVKALVQPGLILVSQRVFPVEPGDTIVREMEGLPTERYEVLDPSYLKAPGDMSHWEIKVRRVSARPIPELSQPATQTHITNHNYMMTGPTAAVGPGAIATDNAIIQHNNQQTLNVDHAGLASDLVKVRKELLAQAAENEDDHEAVEAANAVDKARKAIAAGDQGGIVAHLKALPMKVWDLGQTLGLAYLDYKIREQLGMP